MPPVTEMALVVGPIEPATKRGRLEVLAASAAARAIVPARRLISRACSASPYSASTTEARAEGVGLDDIGAGVEETVVQLADLVGARADQVLVASLELRAAEVGRGEMHVLDGRPRRAVDNDDPGGQ